MSGWGEWGTGLGQEWKHLGCESQLTGPLWVSPCPSGGFIFRICKVCWLEFQAVSPRTLPALKNNETRMSPLLISGPGSQHHHLPHLLGESGRGLCFSLGGPHGVGMICALR